MIRYPLVLTLTLVATCGGALARQSPPRPDTDGTGNADRRGNLKDNYGNAPWLRPAPVRTSDTAARYRARVVRDIEELDRTSRELVEQAETKGLADRHTIARGASKAAKLSRSLWKNVQYGASERPKPESDVSKVPRQTGDAVERIRTLGRLANEVAQAVRMEDRTHVLDASSRSRVLDLLEQINNLGLWISEEAEL